MKLKGILSNIDELKSLVGGWSGVEPSALEMDLALDRVKRIYEQLRFPESGFDEVEPEVEPQPEPIVEEEQEQEEQEEEVTVEFILADEYEEEIVDEIVEDVIEEIVEDVAVHNDEVEDEEMKRLRRERRNKILSLYDTLESAVKEPEVAKEPEVEVSVNVGVAVAVEPEPEQQSEPEPTPEPKPAATVNLPSIMSQIGINDRFLLAFDLFGGDNGALHEALCKLDAQPTLDDAMIYIAENYQWRGDSEGAKLLNTLLVNRYSYR